MFTRFAMKTGSTDNRSTLYNVDCHISLQLAPYVNSQRKRGTRFCVWTQRDCYLNKRNLTSDYRLNILVCLCRCRMDIDKKRAPILFLLRTSTSAVLTANRLQK